MRVEVNGIRLYFDVEGARLVPDGPIMRERPTLVLLHGGPGADHSTYKPLFSQLADVAQLVYLDQRGAGRSDQGPREAWTHAQWGDDVRAFCDALEIDRPIVLGSSFGGAVAMSYATRHPEHPLKLIFLSTSARLDLDRKLAVFERLGGVAARDVARRFWSGKAEELADEYSRVCVPLYTRKPVDPNFYARFLANGALSLRYLEPGGEALSGDFLPALAGIRCPTLVVGGEDDPVTTIGDMADIAAAIPQHLVRFERLPNCGHGPYLDEPERTIDLVREFIAS